MQSDNENINDLRVLREKKKLSVAEVAEKLKLTSHVIEKLEGGKFAELGAYTYVRGYLKHYTDLLEVDSEKYIQMIPKSGMEVPLINTRSHTAKKVKFKRQSKNFANYAVGTFIFLVISFSGWYLLKNYPSDKNISDTVSNDTLEIKPKNDLEFATSTETASEKQDDSYHYSSLIPANEVTKSKTENDFDSGEIAIPEKTSDNEVSIDDTDVDGTGTGNNIDNEFAKYEIQISATETSWVKVEQQDGVKLHNDLLKPGFVTLKSDEKVHFRIGNKDNVTVIINGEQIDLSRFSRKNIADFNWPQDS